MNKPLILWGGTDINSLIYNQSHHPMADYPDTNRDQLEWNLIRQAEVEQRPIIGICRGAQLISVYNGATLYQHSEGHNCSHTVHCKTKDEIVRIHNVSADHHQIINLTKMDDDDFVIYGFANFPCLVWEDAVNTKEITFVPEVIWFPKTKSLAIQPHPEWMKKDHPFNIWLDNLIFNLYGEHYNAIFNRS